MIYLCEKIYILMKNSLLLAFLPVMFALGISAATPTKSQRKKRVQTAQIVTPKPSASDTTAGEWLAQYMDLRTRGKDSAMPLVSLSDYYKSLVGEYYAHFQRQMLDSMAVNLRVGNKANAVAVIDLYDYLFPDTATRKPDVLYVKGNIIAEEQDTVELKKMIAKLNSLGATAYAEKLGTHLQKIRDFVPADKNIGGWWVSEHFDPYYRNANRFMNVVYEGENTVVYMPWFYDSNYTQEYRDTGKSQLVVPFAQDSIYVLWASDKLNNIDADMTTMLRGLTSTTASIAAGKLSQRNNYSTSTAIMGSVVTSIAEVGINAIIDALSKPSKEVWVREGKFKKHNDFHISGTIRYFWRKINIDGTGEKTKERISDFNMTRLNYYDNIFWLGYSGSIHHPDPDVCKRIKSKKKELKPAVGKQKYFNVMQTRKVWWNAQRALTNLDIDDVLIPSYPDMELVTHMGIYGSAPVDSLYRSKNKNAPARGVVVLETEYKAPKMDKIEYTAYMDSVAKDYLQTDDLSNLTEKQMVDIFTEAAMKITNPTLDFSPAHVAGIKKGDVILSVGGIEVFDQASLTKAVSKFEPCRVVPVVVHRKGKEMEIPVELSWAYRYKETQ